MISGTYGTPKITGHSRKDGRFYGQFSCDRGFEHSLLVKG